MFHPSKISDSREHFGTSIRTFFECYPQFAAPYENTSIISKAFMICFTVQKEFVLMSSLSSVSQPPGCSLVVSIDVRKQRDHHSCQTTTRPFISFIYLEGMRELSQPGRKPGCDTWIPRREDSKIYSFLFLASLLSSLQLLSLLSWVFFASTHGVAGKARHSFVWLGGTRGFGRQPPEQELPCCSTHLWKFSLISSFSCLHRHRWRMNW